MALRGKDTVEIIRTPLVADGGGGFMADPDLPEETLYCGRGEVMPLKPARSLEAAQVAMTAAIRIKLWRFGLPDVKPGDVIRWRGLSYSFTGPFLPVDASEREFVATATQIVTG